jgi:hypothetical protein
MEDKFIEKQITWLNALFLFQNEAQVKVSMERWMHETTGYLCRSLRLVGQDIKYLMYAVSIFLISTVIDML